MVNRNFTYPVNTASTGKKTIYTGNYADNPSFKEYLVAMQKVGCVGIDADVRKDRLSEEQLSTLKKTFNPYKVEGKIERARSSDALRKELIECGVLTAEESALVDLGIYTDISNWHQKMDGSWTGGRRSAEKRVEMNTDESLDVSYMQWLEGAIKLDNDEPYANDISQARKKLYAILTEIYGTPDQENDFMTYFNSTAMASRIRMQQDTE